MKKRNNIIYWVSTIWLALGMVSTGMVQLIKQPEEVAKTHTHLGYPLYFLTMIGLLKMLGVIVILLPKFPKLKEWAYAGFVFTMMGALYSHFACGDEAKEYFGPTLLLLLVAISWYFRPAERKLTNQ